MKQIKFISKKTTAIFIVGSTLLIGGCKPATVKPVSTSFTPVTLNFQHDATEAAVSKRTILKAIKNSLEYDLKQLGAKRKARFNFSHGISKVQGYTIFSNCDADTINCQINVELVNGEYFHGTNREHATKQNIIIPVQFHSENNLIKSSISLSGNAKVLEDSNPLFIPYSPYASNHEIGQIFSKASSMKPTVKYSKTFNQQIEVDTNDTVVFANLKRNYGLYIYADDQDKGKIGKKTAFNLSTKQGKKPLYVEIYPTRKGSVMDYSFTLTYSANPNGTTDFIQDEIDGINKSINTVASM